MKDRLIVIIVILLALVVIISGCDTVKNILPKRCPVSCDDSDTCTQEKCNDETDYTCQHELLAPCDGNKICEDGEYLSSIDCPNCDDSNVCTRDTYSYSNSSCGHEGIPNCCGNSVCERGEDSVSMCVFAGQSQTTCGMLTGAKTGINGTAPL